MKKIISALAVLFMVTGAYGAVSAQETVTAYWDLYTPNEYGMTGLRLYDEDHNIVIDNIPIDNVSADFTIANFNECRSYYLRAFNAEKESKLSNIYAICPEEETITGVGTFTIELRREQQQ